MVLAFGDRSAVLDLDFRGILSSFFGFGLLFSPFFLIGVGPIGRFMALFSCFFGLS